MSLTSGLPWVFSLTTANNLPNGQSWDNQPLQLNYGGWSHSTDDSECSVGGWAGGYRQIDCGFTC